MRNDLLFIVVFWIVVAFAALGVLLLTHSNVFPTHSCFTFTNQTTSHFDTANITAKLNITHYGYCMAV